MSTPQVWDMNYFNKQLGTVQIALREIRENQRLNTSLNLQGGNQGTLDVDLQWLGILTGA